MSNAVIVIFVHTINQTFFFCSLFLRSDFKLVVKNSVNVVNTWQQSVDFCCGYCVFSVRWELFRWILGLKGLGSILLLICTYKKKPHSHLAFLKLMFLFCYGDWWRGGRETGGRTAGKRIVELIYWIFCVKLGNAVSDVEFINVKCCVDKCSFFFPHITFANLNSVA